MTNWRQSAAAVAVLLMVVFAAGGTVQAAVDVKPPGVVNLNTATVDQLRLLPSIGEKRAQRIVSFRRVKPFKRVIELARVKGIGMKTVRKLKVYLTVKGPTTLSRRP